MASKREMEVWEKHKAQTEALKQAELQKWKQANYKVAPEPYAPSTGYVPGIPAQKPSTSSTASAAPVTPKLPQTALPKVPPAAATTPTPAPAQQTAEQTPYTPPPAPSFTPFQYEGAPEIGTFQAGQAPTFTPYQAPDAPVFGQYQAPQAPQSGTYTDPVRAEIDKFVSTGYMPGQTVTDAYADFQTVKNAKPGAYTNPYDAQISEAFGNIMGRGKFQYDMNADTTYQQMKDRYLQQGNQAMMDTIGQSSALTGGYGNSWAQSAGQQAYGQHLQALNDQIPALRAQAFNEWGAEGEDLYRKMTAAQGMDDRTYGKYRDQVGDWQQDYANAGNLYTGERAFDYGKFNDQRTFDYGKYFDEVSRADSIFDADRTFGYNRYADDRAFDRSAFESDRDFGYGQFYDDRAFKQDAYKDARDFGYSQFYDDRAFKQDQYRDERDFGYGQYYDERANQQEEYRDSRDFGYQQFADAETMKQQRYDTDRAFAYGQSYDDRNFQQDQYRDERDYGYGVSQDALTRGDRLNEYEQSRMDAEKGDARQTALEIASQLIEAGRIPDQATLDAAGISLADAQQLAAAYTPPPTSGGGGRAAKPENTSLKAENYNALKDAYINGGDAALERLAFDMEAQGVPSAALANSMGVIKQGYQANSSTTAKTRQAAENLSSTLMTAGEGIAATLPWVKLGVTALDMLKNFGKK